MEKEVIEAHKISDDEYKKIVEILGREPNLLELGIFSAMWSEHCSYKSSKKYLLNFPTKAPWVLQGPGENAGVIDCGDGVAAVFKMESHNHPSFIEPFQGAATGVGGICRDIFTMGARVEASMNSLRFGDIENNRYQRYLVKGVSDGISSYGNSLGVPTIGGETTFDESFNGNILVNAFGLGICKSDELFYGKAEGVGNLVLYAGSKTGRDGLGGAVMASDSFSEENNSLRPTVQVGDPFVEKLLMEACLELFKSDCVVGIQDMGAAGLTSSSFEMAGRSGSGMKLYLDKVPQRERAMTPYELMLSESQERMLICIKKGSQKRVKEIFEKWELEAKIIGEVTDSGKMELFWHDELVGEIPIDPLSKAAPVLNRPTKKPAYLDEIANHKGKKVAINNQELFLKLLKDPNILNKSYIYDKYDAFVGTNTVKAPGSLGASVLRIKENGKLLSMGMECNTKMNYIDPFVGAALAVAIAGRKVAMSGAKPLAITDCLNYGNPENPEVMWQFMMGCDGIKEACTKLNTPVVSGNVSLYNETDLKSIQPTPAIACVGINEGKNLPSTLKEGFEVVLIGDTKGVFAGSLYQQKVYGEIFGVLPKIDYEKEKALWDFAIEANSENLLGFANSVGVGGVAITLAKMAAVGDVGGEFKMDCKEEIDIFDESFSRAIVGVKEMVKFQKLMKKYGLSWQVLGSCKKESKFVLNDVEIELSKLKELYFNEFKKIVTKDLI